jgi:hypothetical protein
VLVAVFLGYAGRTAGLSDEVRLGATFAVVISIVLLGVRLIRRR